MSRAGTRSGARSEWICSAAPLRTGRPCHSRAARTSAAAMARFSLLRTSALHASFLEEVAKSQSPLKVQAFKCQPPYERFCKANHFLESGLVVCTACH